MKATLGGPREEAAARMAPFREAVTLGRIAGAWGGAPARRELQTGQHFLATGELDCAEICLNKAITLDAKSRTRVSAEALVAKGRLAGVRKQFKAGRRLLEAARSLSRGMEGAADVAAFAWWCEGLLLVDEGRSESAIDAFHRGAAAYAACEAPREQARSLYLAGHHEEAAYRYAAALTHYREAAVLTDDPLICVACAHGEARVLLSCGRIPEAEATIERGTSLLASHRVENATQWAAGLEELRAHGRLLLGDTEGAKRTQAAVLRRSSGGKRAAICAHHAALLFSMGDPDSAGRYERQARSIVEAMPTPPASMLLGLSRLNLLRGRVGLADEQLFDAGLELPEARSRSEETRYLLHRLDILKAQAEVTRGTAMAREILEEIRPAGEVPLLASVLCARADLLRLCDRMDDAEADYRRALSVAERLGCVGTQAQVHVGLAQVEISRGEFAVGRDHLARALSVYSTCGARVAAHGVRVLAAALPDRDPQERSPDLERLLAYGYRYESVSTDATTTLLLGGIHLETGDRDAAERYLRDVLREAEEAGLQHAELTAKAALAMCAADAGQSAEAVRAIEATLTRMDELGLDSALRAELAGRYRDLTGFPWE